MMTCLLKWKYPGSLDYVFGSITASRKTWPEVVGLTAEEAETKIKGEMPEVQVHLIPPGSFFTLEYNPQRVRLHDDSSGKVTEAPQIG